MQKAANNESGLGSNHFGYHLGELNIAKLNAYDVLQRLPDGVIKKYKTDKDILGRLGRDLEGNPTLKNLIEERGENGFLGWKYADDAYPDRPWCF